MKRANAHAVVYREIPEQKRVMNLFGSQQTISKHCPSCKTFLPNSSFYLKSQSKQKTGNEVERICCDCWDTRKKQRLKHGTACESNTLFEFI